MNALGNAFHKPFSKKLVKDVPGDRNKEERPPPFFLLLPLLDLDLTFSLLPRADCVRLRLICKDNFAKGAGPSIIITKEPGSPDDVLSLMCLSIVFKALTTCFKSCVGVLDLRMLTCRRSAKSMTKAAMANPLLMG